MEFNFGGIPFGSLLLLVGYGFGRQVWIKGKWAVTLGMKLRDYIQLA